jgi:hypothetical protein
MNHPALSWYVYNSDGERIGATVHGEDAAALVSVIGKGATIRRLGILVWTEGVDGLASDSFEDVVAHANGLIDGSR